MKNAIKKALSFLTVLVMMLASSMTVNAANTIINTSQVPNLYPKETLSKSEINSLREKNWTNGETFSGKFKFIENMANYNGHESFKVSLTSGKAGSVKNARAYCLIHNAKSDFTPGSTATYHARVKVTSKSTTENYVRTTTETIRVIIRCNPPGGKQKANETSGSGWQDMGFWFQFTKISTENLEKPKYSLKIRKQPDSQGHKLVDSNLSGAVYSVREGSASGKEVATITTARDGTGSSSVKLEEGTYYLVETKAPSNGKFQISNTPIRVDLKESTAEQSFEVKDAISTARIKIEKKDTEGRPLQGVTFGVYSNENTTEYKAGDLIATLVTDNKGEAMSEELQLGKYYIKEIKTLEGFKLSEIKHEAELKTAAEVITVSAVNEREEINIHTTATAQATDSHVGNISKNMIISDAVELNNLIRGKTYTLKAKLMDKSTKKPLLVNGKEVTATKTFTAENRNEKIEVKLSLDSTSLAGKRTVVFEDLYEDSKLVAVHADINDEGQTVVFPEIHTTATVNGSKVVPVSHKTVITDVVALNDLIRGKTYTMKAKLMDKSTKKPLLVNGKEVTATKTFTSEGGNEKVEMNLTFDSYSLGSGVKTVVYEEVYDGNALVAVHADINDEGQTIEFEKLLTSVSVRKVDSMTKEVIKSKKFAFTIYSDKECTEEIKTVHANTEDGTATFIDVEYGTYYIKESKAPVGYELSDEVKKIVVDENLENVGETYTFEYMNTPLPAAAAQTTSVAVKTGDATDIIANIILVAGSALMLIAIWLTYGRAAEKKN